jgi:hypothetical protein
LYAMFKPVNESLSLLAALFSLAGCAVQALSNFLVLSGPGGPASRAAAKAPNASPLNEASYSMARRAAIAAVFISAMAIQPCAAQQTNQSFEGVAAKYPSGKAVDGFVLSLVVTYPSLTLCIKNGVHNRFARRNSLVDIAGQNEPV